MSSLDLTRDWLNNVLRPYPARERLVAEVMDILRARRTLAVKTDAFTFDTGQTALLLLMHGTLPIVYRGATYQIPVHVWVPHEYPRGPPLAFVVPTKDMGVRKGREVDPSGRIRPEVVDAWWAAWPDKSVEMLLKQLISVFSTAPPVYAKPPDQATSPAPRPAPQAQPIPAGPNGTASQLGLAGPMTGVSPVSPSRTGPQGPPPPPARPFSGQFQPVEHLPQYRAAPTPPPIAFSPPPAPGLATIGLAHPQTPPRHASMPYPGGTSSPHPASPGLGAHSPPVPNRPGPLGPPHRSGSMPDHQQAGPSVPLRPLQPPFARPLEVPAMPRGPPGPGAGFQPPHVNAGPGFYPPNGQGMSQYQAVPQNGPPPTHGQMYGAQPPGAPGYLPPGPPPMGQPFQGQITSDTRQQAPAPAAARNPPQGRVVFDLMSAADDDAEASPATGPQTATSPPPLPPSKPPPPSLLHLHSILLPHLNATLPPLLHQLQSTRAQLLERKEDLASGEPAVRDEMARLEAVKKVCDATGRKMEDVVRRGGERVQELETRGEISVDEVVCGISIVHNQLIDLVAEDNAIEDTIYHMARALDTERIDLDRFLKSIRSLAREQYMKRALIERILQGMGQTQGW